MKIIVSIALILSLGLVSCSRNKVDKSDLKTTKDKVSYAIGMDIGKNLRKNLIEVDPDKFLAGIKDGLLSDTSKVLTEAEVMTIMQEYQKDLAVKQQAGKKAEIDKNKKASETFMRENGKKPGVVTLTSGLQYKVITSGNGKKPVLSDKVVAHYRGTLIDGKEFDNSIKRGQPAEFSVAGVIKGWSEALQLMKVGDKWMLFIPSDLAYGDQGAGGIIPPGAALVFEVELIGIK